MPRTNRLLSIFPIIFLSNFRTIWKSNLFQLQSMPFTALFQSIHIFVPFWLLGQDMGSDCSHS